MVVATVLIIGASRGIGLETVKAALKAGHSVRALARSARRIPVDHPKLEKMAGDALEMATVKRALTGIDVVVFDRSIVASCEAPLKIQQKNSENDRSGPIGAATRKGDRGRPSVNYSRKICQSQKFILRYNGVFGPCEIGKLIDSEGFSLFPRERQ